MTGNSCNKMGHTRFSLLFSLAVLFLHLLGETNCGHFLTIEDLEEFYDLEEKLVSTFTTYIEEQKQSLEIVKQRYEEQKRWQPVINNTDEYLSNPLNVHAMLKRLVTDWPLTLALLEGSFADEEEEDMINLPSVKEYQESVHSIARLQLVYNISISELVSGSAFPGTDITSVLTVDDCMAVGRDMYEHKHYQLAIDWFKEALAQTTNLTDGEKDVATNTGSEMATSPLENIYEYLALSTCFIGDNKQSKKYFTKLYNKFPEFRPTQTLISDHLLALNDTCKKLIKNEDLKPKDHDLDLTWDEDAKLSTNYSKLCQAETLPNASHSLSCMLMDWEEPYWRLQPFKMEELHHDPDIYLTYDVFHQAQKQYFVETFMDERNMNMNRFLYEFWQPFPQNSSITDSLIRKLEWVSGATVHNNREHVLLASAPAGAEYLVDSDVYLETQNPEKSRLATSVIFLEEAQAGGQVVFPLVGVSVAPVTGAVLTWFNVNSEGKTEQKAAYGMCPIKQGHQTMLILRYKRE